MKGGADSGIGRIIIGIHEVEHGLDCEAEVAPDAKPSCAVFLHPVVKIKMYMTE
jgi:hypothetical protein